MKSLQIKQLSESATLPTRAHEHDAGLDLYASETVMIYKDMTRKVPTGIAVDIPPGYEATIRPRSGKTANTALRVNIGTIDSRFQGELQITCDCYGSDIFYRVEKGEKIAQLVISPIVTPSLEIVDQFHTQSERGSNGFGSTDEVHR